MATPNCINRVAPLLLLAMSAHTRAAEEQSGFASLIHDVVPFGRIHQDYSRHHMDDLLPRAPVDGAHTRRLRLGLKGKLGTQWTWDAEYDFAGNVTVPKDVKLGYMLENGAKLYIGHQKQPYNLSLEMGSNDIPFVERSIDNKLVDVVADRAKGIRLDQSGANWFFAGGVFTEMAHAPTQGNDHWAAVARFVWQPVHNEDRVVHLAMRGLYRNVDPLDALSFAAKTTANSDLKIVSTGGIAHVERAVYYGPEFAFAQGPLMVFGEYNAANLARTDARTLDFTSWHVAAAWALTGETRATFYAQNAGEFKGLAPAQPFDPSAGHWGALELVARLAAIDLNDADITGGSEETLNIGLNWYLNTHARAMLDWTHILDTDASNAVRRYAEGGNVFTLRAQYMF